MRLGVQHRPLLLAAALFGLACGHAAFLLGQPAPQAVLLGWCPAVLLWLVLVTREMHRSSPQDMQRRAARLDEGKWAVLAATLAAALASVVAVVWDIAAAPRPAPAGAVVLGLVAIALSWAFVHVLFATHYAHEYWLEAKGISFPGCGQPDFWEFLYFALTVGMTFQVSDATTETPAMRRLVLLHGITAFLFNAVILAAAVNLAATLAG